MDLTGDELAGIVDLFGGLTPAELERALDELAFKRGVDPPADEPVADAIDAYALVAIERDGERLLVPGPAAFPALPEGAEDLPHILDVAARTVDREALGRAVEERFRGEAARAVARDDAAAIDRLLDVSYDLEAWAPVDLSGARDRLDAADPTN